MEKESTSLVLFDTSSPITLELLLLRDCTPIMSYSFFYDLKARQRAQKDTGRSDRSHAPQIQDFDSSATTDSIDSAILTNDSHGEAPVELQRIDARKYALAPAKSLPSDVNLVGVYGISVDEQGHVWFSTNHLSIIHKLNGRFEVIEQYWSLDEERYRVVNNFREIMFKGSKAYVLDAGTRNNPPQIHIFQMPGFVYERSIDIPYTADELFSWSTKNFWFYKDEIIIYHGALTDNSGEHLPSARLQIVEPLNGRQRFIMIDGMEEVVIYEDKIYGISAPRNPKNHKKPGTGPQHIVRLNEDFSPGERITSEELQKFLKISGPIYVDREGLLFKVGNLYDNERDKWDSWIAAATLDGKVLGMQKLLHGISPICFDNENNLIGTIHYKSKSDNTWHLLLGKWRINYREMVLD